MYFYFVFIVLRAGQCDAAKHTLYGDNFIRTLYRRAIIKRTCLCVLHTFTYGTRCNRVDLNKFDKSNYTSRRARVHYNNKSYVYHTIYEVVYRARKPDRKVLAHARSCVHAVVVTVIHKPVVPARRVCV